ncbi:MAG: hypothetical protein V5A66_05540 [Candidatus Thermoplasmatota archaeon]
MQDSLIQREYGSAEGFRRGVLYNPVAEKIGPSYDTDSIIEEMEKNSDFWHLEDIRSQIDLEEITKLPGQLSVYYQDKMHWNYVLITYTYLSPIPITRVYGFRIIEEGEVAALRVAETVIYPLDPGRVDAF